MRARDVIAAHGNTDFDAFALDARRAAPLSRGVGRACGLAQPQRARVLPAARGRARPRRASRLELDAIRRLIVVETVHAARLGELEPRRARSRRRDDRLRPPPGELDGLGGRGDGGPLGRRRADDHAGRHPRRARARADRDRGDRLRARHPRGHRLAHVRDDDPARRRRARLVPPSRRPAGSARATFCTLPLAAPERELLHALLGRPRARRCGRRARCSSQRLRGRATSTASPTSRTSSSTSPMRARWCSSWRWRSGSSASCAAGPTRVDAAARRAGARRRRSCVRGLRDRPRPLDEARRRALDALPEASREPVRARNVMSTPARSVSPDEHGRTHDGALPAARAERHVRRRETVASAGVGQPRGSRQGDRPRALARARQGDHERARGLLRRGDAAGRAASARARRRGRPRGGARRRARSSGSSREATSCAPSRGRVSSRRRGPVASRESCAASSGSRRLLEAIAVARRAARRRLPRRRHGARHPARRARASTSTSRRGRRDRTRSTRSAKALGGGVRTHREVRHRRRSSTATASASTSSPPARSSTTPRRRCPTVERATIREDLFRRDFTLNAMAVSLARRGLRPPRRSVRRPARPRRRTLRVLHNLSFIDDPTRIFRAIRYESRYGLRMERSTRSGSPAAASRWGSSRDLSASRLRDELQALLEEERARAAILRPRRARRGSRDSSASRGRRGGGRRCTSAWPRFARSSGSTRPLWRLGLAVLARRLQSRRGVRLAGPPQGSPPRRRARSRRRSPSLRGSSSGFRPTGSAGRARRTRRSVRARRAALRARARRPRAAARLLRTAARRAARDRRRRPRGARPRGVAAGGGDPRRAPPAQAERRARRARLGARRRPRADRRGSPRP